MFHKHIVIWLLGICILAYAAWRILTFSTVIGVDPGDGLGVQMYDLMAAHREVIRKSQIDELGVVLSEKQFSLMGYVQHGLIPIATWSDRLDLEHVMVIGYAGQLPAEMQMIGQWSIEMKISDEIVIYNRKHF
jgi:isocitrate/isopropylmalate dehydrogenase